MPTLSSESEIRFPCLWPSRRPGIPQFRIVESFRQSQVGDWWGWAGSQDVGVSRDSLLKVYNVRASEHTCIVVGSSLQFLWFFCNSLQFLKVFQDLKQHTSSSQIHRTTNVSSFELALAVCNQLRVTSFSPKKSEFKLERASEQPTTTHCKQIQNSEQGHSMNCRWRLASFAHSCTHRYNVGWCSLYKWE